MVVRDGHKGGSSDDLLCPLYCGNPSNGRTPRSVRPCTVLHSLYHSYATDPSNEHLTMPTSASAQLPLAPLARRQSSSAPRRRLSPVGARPQAEPTGCHGYVMAHDHPSAPSDSPIDPYAIVPCHRAPVVPRLLSQKCRSSSHRKSCKKAAYCAAHWCGACKRAVRIADGGADRDWGKRGGGDEALRGLLKETEEALVVLEGQRAALQSERAGEQGELGKWQKAERPHSDRAAGVPLLS